MSSTASPRRTEAALPAPAAAGRFGPRLPVALAAVLLSLLLVSFRPFQPATAATAGGGDLVNQLGFGTLGLLAVSGLAALAPPRLVAALPSPSFILLLGLFALSVMGAADPAAAARTASFTLIGIVAVAAVLVLPPDADGFSAALWTAGAAVLGLSFAGLVLFPDLARHTADSLEPEHAGLWRGVFSHKNVAGPVVASFAFAGVYLFRRGWRRRGTVLFLAALVFMLNTGSKTTAGLVPLSILLVTLPGLFGMRGLVPPLVAMALGGTALLTLGTVFFEPLRLFAAAHLADPTFTGRTALWRFAGEMIAERPLWGYGYESFWGTPMITGMDRPFDIDWDIRGIVHGHNGYLDAALAMGVPAALVLCWVVLVAPLSDYRRVPLLAENVRLADFFMMVTLFATLNAFLESFFFRRADPVWLFLVMGVLGLRLVARFPVRGRAS